MDTRASIHGTSWTFTRRETTAILKGLSKFLSISRNIAGTETYSFQHWGAEIAESLPEVSYAEVMDRRSEGGVAKLTSALVCQQACRLKAKD